MYGCMEYTSLGHVLAEEPLRECQQGRQREMLTWDTSATEASALFQQVPNEGKRAELLHVHINQGRGSISRRQLSLREIQM